jgi:farnesyl diphosphate synthase
MIKSLNDVMFEFEEFIKKSKPEIESFHPYYKDGLWEMILNGGKRFRPRLFLLPINTINPLLVSSSFDVALAIEALHTYSLIHDDLPAMDNANTRRGHATLHKKYDEVGAILIGDALNTYAFYLISNSPLQNSVKVDLIKELSLSGGASGMVLGQALDCYFEKKRVDFEKLKFIHTNKTAKLIASSLKMGGIVLNLEKSRLQKLYDFGLELGLLFQIEDDILDVTKSSNEAGKDTNVDEFKNSYVNFLGLDGAKDEAKRVKDSILDMCKKFENPLQDELLKIIN